MAHRRQNSAGLDEPHLVGSPVAQSDVEWDDPDVMFLSEASWGCLPRYR